LNVCFVSGVRRGARRAGGGNRSSGEGRHNKWKLDYIAHVHAQVFLQKTGERKNEKEKRAPRSWGLVLTNKADAVVGFPAEGLATVAAPPSLAGNSSSAVQKPAQWPSRLAISISVVVWAFPAVRCLSFLATD